MRNHSVHTWKAVLAKVLVAVMLMLSVAFAPTTTMKAATTPTLTKSSKNILVGNTYNLNVVNKIAKSTYKWTSSDKKVATVNNRGVVTGIKKGTAVITCTVKASDDTYKLTCNVTVVKPAVLFRIKNKVTALNVGQVYDVNRTIAPSSSNDKTTWVSSDTSIAAPDKQGKFTALKEGTVTITGKTLSGKTDSMTLKVVDKDGTVTNQKELKTLLGSGVELITIKTAADVDLNIPNGNYSKTKLVVEAPKADVHNYGVFASIDIKQIAANSWYENAVGNLLNVLASDSRIVVSPNAKVKIEVNAEGAKLTIENNGVIEEVVVQKPADLNISGDADNNVPVVVNVPNITITSSVPLNLDCNKKIELVLLPGAEKTSIQAASEDVIPAIKGSITVKVKVGTGENAKDQEVKPTPIVTQAPTTGGNTGGATPTVTPTPTPTSTPTPTPTPTPTATPTPTPTYSKTFSLAKPITEVTAISVSYQGQAYTISSTTLDTLVHMLNNETLYIDVWKGTIKTTQTYDGQTVTVSGTDGDSTKTVSFSGGPLDGRSYLVTLNSNGSVTVVSKTTSVAFTISKGTDNKTLIISGDQTKLASVTFTIVSGSTYTLEQSYTNLTSINVTYKGHTYSVGSTTLTTLKFFLSNEAATLALWKNTTNTTNTYDSQSVTVAGDLGSFTKTVSFTGGQLDGKSYRVTVNSDSSVTVVSITSGVSFTISKGTDNMSLTITGAPSGLTFAPSFN